MERRSLFWLITSLVTSAGFLSRSPRMVAMQRGVNQSDGPTTLPADSGTLPGSKQGLNNAIGQIDVKTPGIGAIGDGNADDTAAFRLAYTLCNAGFSSSSNRTGQSLSKPTMWLGHGVYKITGSIDNGVAGNGMRIAGDGAIIELSAGVTFLDNVRYFLYMEGVTVRGGAKHIGIKTGNNECTLIFDRCEFMSPSSRIFDIDATSQSTQLLVQKCRLFTEANPAAQVIVGLSGDYIIFADCFIKVSTAAASCFDVTDSKLFISRMVGVPVNLHSWVALRGTSSLYADPLTRFGGEFAGTTESIVECHGPGYTFQEQLTNAVHLDGCEAYSTGTLINLYAIPNMIIIENVIGLPGTDPVKVQPSVTAAQLSRIGEITNVFRIKYNGWRYGTFVDPVGAPAIAREGLPLVEDRVMMSGRPDVADLVYQSQGNSAGYGRKQNSANLVISGVDDAFGVPALQFTAAADNGAAQVYYLTALNGLVAGVYTCVFDIEVLTDTAVMLSLRASNTCAFQQFTPTRGRHSICLPFYYDGVGATGYLPKAVVAEVSRTVNGAVIQWQRWRIYKGRRHISGPRVELEGTRAPTMGQYYRGDRVYNTAKVQSSDVDYWTCLAAVAGSGQPGTWAPNRKIGTFTMAAGPTTVVRDTSVLADSKVSLLPNSAAAAALQGSANAAWVQLITPGVSFTVATAGGHAATGMEIYHYVIVN